MRTLDSIIAASAEAFQPLLQEAFEAGRSAGRAEADDLRAKMAALISVGQSLPPVVAVSPGAGATTGDLGRAIQGSVKPRIAKLIADSGTSGVTPSEITYITGFKANTVRGTIWTLGQEGSIVKRGSRWYPRPVPDDDDAPL